ncbi:MAG: Aldehyde dehydrogenase [uncultured Actinomycetospora sp.]|uniref:Aldehyde dehydrogenase n=1 Tax=uncultured Actinomycetospora sp. TaxID=1135996 RepID=A0A6J4H333_9PSEU|nr:MAG: Aldehyde dehydrogenase [uncultured Actinomycetospora sp.]
MTATLAHGAAAEHRIGGQRVPSRHEPIPVEDPSTATTVAHVARGDARDVDRAVSAARAAARRTRSTTPAERGRLLRSLAAALRADLEGFARLETLDTGKPLSLARSEIAGCVAYLDYYAGAADKLHGETIPLGPGSLAYTVREPVGVTAHIVPWNAPLSMLCRSVARPWPPGTPRWSSPRSRHRSRRCASPTSSRGSATRRGRSTSSPVSGPRPAPRSPPTRASGR